MKKIKKILVLLLCIFAMGALFAPVYAAENADCTLSADNLKAGDTFTATVSIKEVTASSLGVSIECDDTIEIVDGKWLKSGLIASFDPAKNKGAYTAGSAASISGDIFEITFRSKTPSVNRRSIFVTVIAKNSTVTLFNETVVKTVNISCNEHDFGNYDKTGTHHSRQCKLCKYTEEQKHVWDKGNVTLKPTCEKDGEKLFTCTACSYGKVEKVDKLSHTTTVKGAKKATCTKEGYTGDKVCSVCDTVLEKGSAIAKTSHTPTVEDAKKATCTKEGYTGDKVCSVCDTVLEKGSVIAKTSHTPTVEDAKKATCTKEGYTGDKVCSVCDTLLEKGSTIAKTSHNYANGFCVNCNVKSPDKPSPLVSENSKPTTTTKPDTTVKPARSDNEDSFITTTTLIVSVIVIFTLVTMLVFILIRKHK